MNEDTENTEQPKHRVLTKRLRTPRGAPRWGLLIGIAVVVLAAGLVGGLWGTSSSSSKASSASAQTSHVAHRPANDVVLTQGFNLHDYSGYTLKYTGYTSPNGGSLEGGGPPVGTIIDRTQSYHFEAVYKFLTATDVYINLELVDSGNIVVSFDLVIGAYNTPSATAVYSPTVMTSTCGTDLYVGGVGPC